MEELRIVVVGKAGAGKTSLINTILGKESTAEYCGSECEVTQGVYEKEPVVFIDTPGLLRTDLTKEKLTEELLKCILRAAPGPHVFLYVKEKEPFTTEEERAVNHLEG
ncbi:GTPase IMAP family member 4-like [Mugil cephalus]|uniref:GTPase IMAP family member 4-like n=1 Tax=Mugil cephalus TaxID=48193 RepID=UPI001FB5888D|nr:GTPase IMAP family member 4-like [Mugil cephalus]